MYGYLKLRLNMLQWKVVFVFVEDRRRFLWFAEYPVGKPRKELKLTLCEIRLERAVTDFTLIEAGGAEHRFRASHPSQTGMWFAHIRMLQRGYDPSLLPSAHTRVRFRLPDDDGAEKKRLGSPPLSSTAEAPAADAAAESAPKALLSPTPAAAEPTTVEMPTEETRGSLLDNLVEMGFDAEEAEGAIEELGDRTALQPAVELILTRRTEATGMQPTDLSAMPEPASERPPVSPRRRRDTPHPSSQAPRHVDPAGEAAAEAGEAAADAGEAAAEAGEAAADAGEAAADAGEAAEVSADGHPGLKLDSSLFGAEPPGYLLSGGEPEEVSPKAESDVDFPAPLPKLVMTSPEPATQEALAPVLIDDGAGIPPAFLEEGDCPANRIAVEVDLVAAVPPGFFQEGSPAAESEPDFEAFVPPPSAAQDMKKNLVPVVDDLMIVADGSAGVMPGFVMESDLPSDVVIDEPPDFSRYCEGPFNPVDAEASGS